MDSVPLEDAVWHTKDDLLSSRVKACQHRNEQGNENEIIDVGNPENNIKNSNGNNAIVVLDGQADDKSTTSHWRNLILKAIDHHT